MSQSKFLALARRVLEEEGRPLSPEEIWEIAGQKGYAASVGTSGKTPWQSIGAQTYLSIRDDPHSPFCKAGSRPTRFALKSMKKSEAELMSLAAKQPLSVNVGSTYTEADLHPFLAYFGSYYLKAYLKTIRHSTSDRRRFGEWVHPDMVGVYYTLEEWTPEVVDLSSVVGDTSVKLYSFEIKKALDISSLRESFFQTVSNSSWANESYLAAAEISKDEDFRSELSRLSTSFGIGVIQLDTEDPDSSEIVFPARYREALDWDGVNKLTMNADFKEFLRRVKTDISSQEIRKEKYDPLLDKEELVRKIRRSR